MVSSTVIAVVITGVVQSGGTTAPTSLTSLGLVDLGTHATSTGTSSGGVEVGARSSKTTTAPSSHVDAGARPSTETATTSVPVTNAHTSAASGHGVSQPYTVMSGGNAPSFVNEVSAWIGATGWVGGTRASSADGLPIVPTTTSLAVSDGSVTYANQSGVTFSVTVSPLAAGVVTVDAPGAQLCQVSLQEGAGSCNLPVGELDAGVYPIVANFTGAGVDAASQSAASTLTIDPSPTTTSLSLSAASVAYGAEPSELFSVSVSRSASGMATVSTPAGALCQANVINGSGTCSPVADSISAGSTTVSASFAGSSDFAGSSSTSVPLTVTGGDGGGGGGSTPNSSLFGVYAGAGNPSSVSDFAGTMGGHTKFAMDFFSGTSWSAIDSISWWLSQWKNSGYTMIWGVPILPNTGASLATGATGAYDQYFTTLAKELVAGGQGSSIIRLGWEFNGGWFPWAANGHAADFVAYWQQIVTTMRAVPGANFTFEWNPTRGDMGVGNLANYYPGDAYVDYVGLDVYDTEWGSYPGASQEFAKMETQTYGLNWLASFSAQHDKPMVFPEWGLGWGDCSASGQPITDANTQVCGGDDATFINDMSQWIASHNVFEANYWDYGTSTVDKGNNPLTAAALAKDFG